MAVSLSPTTTTALFQTGQIDAPLTGKQARLVQKATEAAEEFEAVFIAEMMKPMFEGISTEAPFGGGKGEEVFRSLLLQEYGKQIARTGHIGLSPVIKDAMIRMQAAIDNKGVETSNAP